MNSNNGRNLKTISLNGLKNLNLSRVKERGTNTSVSTQCEDKPKQYKPFNQFTAFKSKSPMGPFVLKKTPKNQDDDEVITSTKLIQPSLNSEDFAPTLNRNNHSTNFIPLLKYTSSSIDNVSRLISNGSSCSLSRTPQIESKLTRSDSSSNIQQLLIKNLVKNEKQTNSNSNNLKIYDEHRNASPKHSMLPSSFIIKSASNRVLSKRKLFIEKEALNDKQIVIASEDMVLIEDKLQDILTTIEEGFTISNECFEWWNFYFSSTLAGNYEEYFLNFANKKKIGSYVNIELLCIIVCYSLSFNIESYQNQIKNIKTIISLLHFNLLLMIKFIMTVQRVYDFSYIKLEMMLKKSLTAIQDKDIDEFLITSLIHHNMTTVSNIYQEIISKEFKGAKDKRLSTFLNYGFQNRDSIPVDEYNEFFRFNTVHVFNMEGSVLASSIKGANPIPIKLKVPYLPIMTHFKYTLVIDLDETLVHIKEDLTNPINTKIFFRPGLSQFLQKMKNRYELVLFTVGTKLYADKIINLIESKEKYFDFRLYRHHATVVGNDFIKDLTKIGRDISRVIIIDNMPQNYRLQKGNGIFIKPYYGDCKNDTALIHLSEILYRIASDNCDVRSSIEKYKDEIISKISLNRLK